MSDLLPAEMNARMKRNPPLFIPQKTGCDPGSLDLKTEKETGHPEMCIRDRLYTHQTGSAPMCPVPRSGIQSKGTYRNLPVSYTHLYQKRPSWKRTAQRRADRTCSQNG